MRFLDKENAGVEEENFNDIEFDVISSVEILCKCECGAEWVDEGEIWPGVHHQSWQLNVDAKCPECGAELTGRV